MAASGRQESDPGRLRYGRTRMAVNLVDGRHKCVHRTVPLLPVAFSVAMASCRGGTPTLIRSAREDPLKKRLHRLPVGGKLLPQVIAGPLTDAGRKNPDQGQAPVGSAF